MITKELSLATVVRRKDQHDSFVLQYKVSILEDGVQIADNIATELLTPDMDPKDIKDAEVRQAAEFYWTPEKVKAFKASRKQGGPTNGKS